MLMYTRTMSRTGSGCTALLCCALTLLLCLSSCTGGTPSALPQTEGPNTKHQTCIDREALTSLLEETQGQVETSAKAHVLLEVSTGAVLARKNADTRLPMASTTKIMTALLALEALPLTTQVVIPREAVGVEGSSVYLIEGETLTMEELLYALLLESANDAAVAIACAVSGSEADFVARMNQRAADMGLTDTCFANPHGLDAEGHYTTARELALITRVALQNETFREIVSTQKKTIRLHGDEGVRLLVNHNRLLRGYEGCIGVKTGYTKKTGRCLVSAAERDGLQLIAVTLGAPDDWNDHKALLNYGFSACEPVELVGAEPQHLPVWTISGEREYTLVSPTETLTVVLPRTHGKLHCTVELPRFTYAPVKAGQDLGQLVWYIETNGQQRCIASVPLTAEYGINAITYKKNFLERLQEGLE